MPQELWRLGVVCHILHGNGHEGVLWRIQGGLGHPSCNSICSIVQSELPCRCSTNVPASITTFAATKQFKSKHNVQMTCRNKVTWPIQKVICLLSRCHQ